MSDTIVFRGAYIRSFEFRNGDGDKHVRIQMTADWSAPVCEHMEWGDVPDGFAACDLIGKLAASTVIFTPSGRGLKDHEIEIGADDVSGFNLVPIKDGEGEVTGRELRFTIKSTANEAAALLECYCKQIGRGVAQLKVSFAKQEVLPLTEEKKPEPVGAEK